MEIRRHCRIKKEIEDADLKLVGIESVTIRPDHGRMIWDEKAMPGYGLYDRALGAAYLNGLWAAIEKQRQR